MKRHFWWHWQNLNDDEKGNPKGWPHEGRAWFNFGDSECRHVWKVKFAWNLWTHFCAIGVGIHEEDGYTFHVGLPPVCFWLAFSPARRFRSARTVEVSIHHWSLFWTIWRDPMGGWGPSVPRWREGNFDFRDFLLGRVRYSTQDLEKRTVVIPMPEGTYPSVATLKRCTWKRPRWFAQVQESIWLEIPNGIPHEGKGENSWDCGQDGLFGCGVDGRSYAKAIAHAVEIVLEKRRKYDGDLLAAYPPPSEGATK